MFDKAFDRVFKHEGGYTADPKDRGNWTGGEIGSGQLLGTKYGISAMSYPSVDIPKLSLEEAKEIYRTDWWESLKMDIFHPALQYQLFDAAINHGMHSATKMIQRAAGVKADGFIGPITQGAVIEGDLNDLLIKFLAERLIFMTHIKTWSEYSKGWARRIAHNLMIAAKDN